MEPFHRAALEALARCHERRAAALDLGWRGGRAVEAWFPSQAGLLGAVLAKAAVDASLAGSAAAPLRARAQARSAAEICWEHCRSLAEQAGPPPRAPAAGARRNESLEQWLQERATPVLLEVHSVMARWAVATSQQTSPPPQRLGLPLLTSVLDALLRGAGHAAVAAELLRAGARVLHCAEEDSPQFAGRGHLARAFQAAENAWWEAWREAGGPPLPPPPQGGPGPSASGGGGKQGGQDVGGVPAAAAPQDQHEPDEEHSGDDVWYHV